MLKIKNLIFPVPIKSISLILLYFILFSHNDFLTRKLFWAILFTWLIFIASCQLLLKIILKHKGLILETRGKDLSIKTRIFKSILKSKRRAFIITIY